MELLHDIPEIKAAVDAGHDVRAGNDNYRVIKDSIGQYLIHFTGHPENWIGLHGMKGTKYENHVNMTPIYIKQKKVSVQIVWGKNHDEPPCLYTFNTQGELKAFLRGVAEAQGWFDYEIVYTDEELET